MESPEEYVNTLNISDKYFALEERITNLIKQVQLDSYNQALEDASNQNNHVDSFYESKTWWIPKDSILKLKK